MTIPEAANTRANRRRDLVAAKRELTEATNRFSTFCATDGA